MKYNSDGPEKVGGPWRRLVDRAHGMQPYQWREKSEASFLSWLLSWGLMTEFEDMMILTVESGTSQNQLI